VNSTDDAKDYSAELQCLLVQSSSSSSSSSISSSSSTLTVLAAAVAALAAVSSILSTQVSVHDAVGTLMPSYIRTEKRIHYYDYWHKFQGIL
jgi:hypothetical protein